jgi:hypothetical protein
MTKYRDDTSVHILSMKKILKKQFKKKKKTTKQQQMLTWLNECHFIIWKTHGRTHLKFAKTQEVISK